MAFVDSVNFIGQKIEPDKTRIPEVGEKLHFWDDGKSGDSRHYLAVVTHVLMPEQAKRIHCTQYADDGKTQVTVSVYEAWLQNVINCDWVYAKETDYFIGCAIPEYDENIIWCVRKKDGGWFSIDIQSWWQAGFLDVTGEKYENNIKEGYTYSVRY